MIKTKPAGNIAGTEERKQLKGGEGGAGDSFVVRLSHLTIDKRDELIG